MTPVASGTASTESPETKTSLKENAVQEQKQLEPASSGAVLRQQGRELHLRVDHDTGTVQAVIVDPAKGRELQRIPTDELIQLAKDFKAQAGALIDKRL